MQEEQRSTQDAGPSTRFRFGYAIRLGLALACGAVASTLTVYLWLASDLGTYGQSFAIVSSVRRLVLGAAAVSGLIQLLVAGLLVAAFALIASHKLAGPTVRLERLLHGMAEGQLPGSLHFRDGDQAGQLAAGFNRLSQALHERHAQAREELDELRSSHREIQRMPEKGGTCPAVDQFCERAEALAKNLERLSADAGSGDAC
jgi:methyl-accepting chemotaxis protein